MSGIEYRDAAGNLRFYPHSFDIENLERLGEFLADGSHTLASINAGAFDKPGIRHDVDHSLEHAVQFARWEASNGLRSTYFLLHTATYWRQPGFGGMVREIRDLGHEIGLHHNTLTAVKQIADVNTSDSYELAHGVMFYAVQKLLNVGADVFGAAAHASEVGLDNLSVWDHWDFDDFGLIYEAYHLNDGANYISDNRGKMRAAMEMSAGEKTILLIHPEHWELPTWTANKELM